MRQPRDLYTTMNGLFSVQLMAALQTIVDLILIGLGGQNWGFFDFIRQSIFSVILDVTQSIVATMFPGAPGAGDYLIAAPEALADVAGNTATTLVEMQGQRRWIQYTYIPQVSSMDQNLSWSLYYDVRGTAFQLYYALLASLYASVNALYAYIGQQTALLTRYIESVQNAAFGYTRDVYNALLAYARDINTTLTQLIDQTRRDTLAYVDQVRSDLQDNIDTLAFTTAAALAAAVAWITGVEIPGAIAAFKLEQTAEIAAGMDVLYPVAAASVDKAALQFALTLPLVSARALDVPPEAVPGVGGMAEALTAVSVFETAVTSNACAPIWTKLHEFADDTAELDGVVATVLLAGMVTAMVGAPEETATVVADALAGPLNDIAVQALSLVGLE